MKKISESNAYAHSEPPVSKRVREAWLKTLANLVAVHSPLAIQTFERINGRADLNDVDRLRLDRLAPWIENIRNPSAAEPPPSDELPFGVIGYRCPDHVAASRNIGDWVQTIALMSHLARRPDIRFTGQKDIAEVFSGLQANVPKNGRIPGPTKKVHLVEINRDATFHDKLPANLWAFIFGWYFKLPSGKLEFPFPENIRPIFISFHISNANHINEDAISYLRKHSPIGCRDLHTLRLLHENGVECYFSGCVTTTIGRLFDSAKKSRGKPVAYVDANIEEIPDDAIQLTNLIDEMKTLPLAKSLDMTLDRLNDYRTKFSKIVTSRLHTYLPAESMGVKVDWLPVHADDRWFDGLAGANEIDHRNISDRIEKIIKVIFDALLTGATEGEIYDIYRREVAPDIDLASSLILRKKLESVNS